MKKIPRYIGSTIVSSTLMVLFVLIAIEVFVVLTAELRNIGVGNYGFFL